MKKMLCIILGLASIIMITGCGGGGGDDQQGLVLTDDGWNYHWHLSQAENSKTMRLENNDGGEVFNDSDVTSGNIILALVLSPEEYDGGDDIIGYNMWQKEYNPLAPGESIGNVDSTQKTEVPPVGDYYVYIILAEYSIQDETYHIRGSISFTHMVRVVNPWDIDLID